MRIGWRVVRGFPFEGHHVAAFVCLLPKVSSARPVSSPHLCTSRTSSSTSREHDVSQFCGVSRGKGASLATPGAAVLCVCRCACRRMRLRTGVGKKRAAMEGGREGERRGTCLGSGCRKRNGVRPARPDKVEVQPHRREVQQPKGRGRGRVRREGERRQGKRLSQCMGVASSCCLWSALRCQLFCDMIYFMCS